TWTTGSQPCATAAVSTVCAPATLAALVARYARESRLYTAAACTTASQPDSAASTASASVTSPTPMVDVAADPVWRQCGGDPVRGADQQPYLVASRGQCRDRVGADEPGAAGDQYAHPDHLLG